MNIASLQVKKYCHVNRTFKLTYSPLGKAFEEQIKTIQNQGIKQVEALKALKSEENKVDIK